MVLLIMGRPKGSKNKAQSVDNASINLTGAQAPVVVAPKAQGENTLGKVMRSVTITFAPRPLTARKSGGGS